MPKKTLFGREAREKIQAGGNLLANAVKVTLGAMGRHVIINNPRMDPHPTKDGVTVARSIEAEDPAENIGVEMFREVASQTVDQAGDGTTTATVLAQALVNSGLKAIQEGYNPVLLKASIEGATAEVVKKLKSLAQNVETAEELTQIATISANNDPILGSLIADVVGKVGKDGSITIENSLTGETHIQVVEGMRLESGYVNPHFVNNVEKMRAEYTDVRILVCEDEITHLKDTLPLLDDWNTRGEQKPLLLIGKDVNGEVLGALVYNKTQKGMQVCAVRTPGSGDMKKMFLEDIAIATGATVISEDKGLPLKDARIEHLGRAAKFIVARDRTVIIEGAGNPAEVKKRCDSIKAQMTDAKRNEKDILKQRLASISNGIAVVYVAGVTESEVKEKKDRIDDALCATRAALEEGFIAGCGTAYLFSSNTRNNQYLIALGKKKSLLSWFNGPTKITEVEKGWEIVSEAIGMPFIHNLLNAGIPVNETTIPPKYGYGINVKTGEQVHLISAGIIDPVKVARVALENAASVAGLILTTECISYEYEEVRK